MSLRQKLLVLAVMPAVLGVTAWFLAVEPRRAAAAHALEVERLSVAFSRFEAVSVALRAERSEWLQIAGGHTGSGRSELLAAQSQTDDAVRRWEAILKDASLDRQFPAWERLEGSIGALRRLPSIRAEADAATRVVNAVEGYRTLIDDTARLMDTAAIWIDNPKLAALARRRAAMVAVTDSVDLVHQLIAHAIRSQQVSPPLARAITEAQATTRAGIARSALLDLQGTAARELDSALRIDAFWATQESALEASGAEAWAPPLELAAWLDAAQRMRERLADSARDLADAMSAGASADVNNARTLFWAYAVLLIALGAIALAVTVSSYRRLSGTLSQFLSELEAVAASGNLRTPITVSGRDEIGMIQTLVAQNSARLLELAKIAERHALGDVQTLARPKGEQDHLALALRSLGESQREVTDQANRIASGDYDASITARSEADTLAQALRAMNAALSDYRTDVGKARYASEGQLKVLGAMRSPKNMEGLGKDLLKSLGGYCGARLGALYTLREGQLELAAHIGLPDDASLAARLDPESGQVGRALGSQGTQLLDDLPAGYFPVDSALGSVDSAAVSTTPLRASGAVVGVMEFGWPETPNEQTLDLLNNLGESIAMAVDAVLAKTRTEELLEETRSLASKLEEQQEELRAANEELEEQTQALRQSEEELKMQREELQTSNEELEEKSEALESQRAALQRAAEGLQKATQYKSEFLANMSHELRTPLNSMLILTKQLADNDEGNLTPDQVEAASVVNDSGKDLLSLINEILDLAKVEAGQLSIYPEPIKVADVLAALKRQFSAQAGSKGLTLTTHIDAGLPEQITTDRQRLQQILRNLLSNALKFTSQGEVGLRVAPMREGLPRPTSADGKPLQDEAIAVFEVFDSGIGIPADRLDEIFQPFVQADGSTSRNFGGTGLGLSICREMSQLLGGKVHVESEAGRGSSFFVVLPLVAASVEGADDGAVQTTKQPTASNAAPPPPPADGALPEAAVPDDRANLSPPGDGILVIEDDLRFAAIVRDQVRRGGMKAVVAVDGASGLKLAREYRPHGIVLDLKLPDMDGEQVLQLLKQDLDTRHIPVHIVSASDARTPSLRQGAIGFLPKPASAEDLAAALGSINAVHARRSRVLAVEDDAGTQAAIRSLLSSDAADIETVATGEAALKLLADNDYDCVILDLKLPDIDGFEVLRRLEQAHGDNHPPVVVYTGRQLSRDEHRELSRSARSIVVKGADSPERLIDEVTLFLHALKEQLPEEQLRALERLHEGNALFEGKRLLIVDDDLRNTFALSAALKKHGFVIEIAENGQMAIDKLDQQPDTDLVLMDIMMPVMDGYQTMTALRADPRFAELPIIALTAKAMPEDRRKCIDAGASDYQTKPVDVDRLLAVMRVWLGRAA